MFSGDFAGEFQTICGRCWIFAQFKISCKCPPVTMFWASLRPSCRRIGHPNVGPMIVQSVLRMLLLTSDCRESSDCRASNDCRGWHSGTVGGVDMLPGLAGVPRWATRAGKVPAQAGRYRGLRVGAAPPTERWGPLMCKLFSPVSSSKFCNHDCGENPPLASYCSN